MAWGHTTPQHLGEGGRQAPQPAWLARTLLHYGTMLLWHDRADQSFVATPPSVSMHTAYAIVSGPPALMVTSHRRAGLPGVCLKLGEISPRRMSF